MSNPYLDVLPEVKTALQHHEPVVALESTIISHGMPYPQNLETAERVERIVRDSGAIPATIAILEGKLKAGLTSEQLKYLAKADNVEKVSRCDIPFVLSGKQTGATTVAATMIIAAMAGIQIFVTGGIGGVHRGAKDTFDISADLLELSQTNVAVVCAGVKSILDIGATLEYLETHGVPVFGYQTSEFPAFYTRKSGFQTNLQADSTGEIAQALKVKWDLNLIGGAVIGNPIPPQHEMDPKQIEAAITQALLEAESKKITGKSVTPFLLTRISEITGEESLLANIELVLNNARIGASLAKDLATLYQ